MSLQYDTGFHSHAHVIFEVTFAFCCRYFAMALICWFVTNKKKKNAVFKAGRMTLYPIKDR